MPRNENWQKISVLVSESASEAVEFAFNSLDSIGTESAVSMGSSNGLTTVAGYFLDPPDEARLHEELRYALRAYGFGWDSVRSIGRELVEQQDWLVEWKKGWKPTVVGKFLVAPPWSVVDDTGKIVVRIEPNMAFGTGTHETTRLCLEAIGEIFGPGMSLLDVGTGTGILAIAAARSANDVGRIVAIDTDEVAIEIARANSDLNHVAHRIEFFAGSLGSVSGQFDLVCANLTADVIGPILPELIAAASSHLVLSGILSEQAEAILKGLPEQTPFVVRTLGEWISITVLTSDLVRTS